MPRPSFRRLCAILALLAAPLTAQDAADTELLDLNARLFHSMIAERDTTLFAELAVEEFQVLAPGGLIEDRGQAIRGVGGSPCLDLLVQRGMC